VPSTCETAAFATLADESAPRAILLVEDEAAVRNVLTRFLSAKGFQVFSAEDARSAESAWHRHRHEIGVVVADILLPGGISGSRLATLLQGERPDLEVILTSGYATEHGEFVAEANAHMDFLPKPYHPDDLIELIRGALSSPSLS
jgi:DNA-binding NtrC family response regulator